MKGMSYMLPFAAGGGILIAIAFCISGEDEEQTLGAIEEFRKANL